MLFPSSTSAADISSCLAQEYSVAELSPTFYAALLVLVKAMYTLGSIQLGNSPNIHLLDAFASTVSQKIQGQLDQESSLTNAVRQQTHFDLSFLRQLSSSESDDMKAVIAKLQPEVVRDVAASCMFKLMFISRLHPRT